MKADPRDTIEIFISYARKDEKYRKSLEKQLKVLKREHLINVWHDREIVPGMEWQQEIDSHLNAADVILLLISPDFMASDYCYGIEMEKAIERHKRRESYVIPIIIRHTYWKSSPIGKLQALPTDGVPVTDPSWYTLDKAFLDVAEGIRKVIEIIQKESLPKAKKEWLHNEALQMLAAIVQSSADAIVSITLDGIITSWNQAAEKLYGYAAHEILGQYFALIIPRDQREGLAMILLSKVRVGEGVMLYDTTGLRKDGSMVSVFITVSPVKDVKGKIMGASISARDISKQKRLETELWRSRQQIEELWMRANLQYHIP